MRLLELFSGTGSIGRAFAEQGWEVTSLDIDPKSGADIVADFMTWDFSIYPEMHFDAIWASPVCTHYSIARTTAKTPRDLEGSDRMVQRVLDCIGLLKPQIWAFENPGSGLLKDRAVVQQLPYKDVSYCAYGYPYRKWTRIWTNSERWQPRPVCCKATPCAVMEGGRHPKSAQRGPSKGRGGDDRCSLSQLYSMPPELCLELAAAFTDEVGG